MDLPNMDNSVLSHFENQVEMDKDNNNLSKL